jgi:hypothetical protein
MAHPILYDVDTFVPKGNDHVRHVNKTAQDKERDITARPRVQAWQKRLNGAKLTTEDACDTQ